MKKLLYAIVIASSVLAVSGLTMSMDKEMETPMSLSDTMTYTVPDDEQLRSRLTSLQYKVVRQNGTEPPFNNTYWDNHEER
jgi:hypothetical protein